MTVFAVHTFTVRYRTARDRGSAVREAEVRATSKAEARVRWRHDPRSHGHTVVSLKLKG